ncbi:MAG: helix-turn-helix transcriptional regulator [Lachnospiraceae bacterium]|nr:helix-turn-helix transcriptional regulator [Lachnospiraceae bacterium]
MFKNKNDSSNNLCGKNVKKYRLEQLPRLSQRGLADKLQLEGIDLDKNAIQRIESGQRFVTDIELLALSKVLNVSLADLLNTSNNF